MANSCQVTDRDRAKIFEKSHLTKVSQEDKKMYFWVHPTILWIGIALFLTPIFVAWVQFLGWGLPANLVYPHSYPLNGYYPVGYPGWLRITHFANLIFLTLLARSGISILMDHPRLYTKVHCTPNSELVRLTPTKVPTDRLWTAKDDVRYSSPWISLPGGKHTVGVARTWHFLGVFGFLANGLFFLGLLLFTNQWHRLVPTSFSIVPQAWNVWVHYATLHFPAEPNGYYEFNPLQQLAYFGVVFVMAPMSLFTGLAMSPAIDNSLPWYPKLFGGRQVARLIHFMLLMGYIGFVVVHLSLVLTTGVAKNMNHITTGQDSSKPIGIYIGLFALVVIISLFWLLNTIAWRYPGKMQRIYRNLITPILFATLNKLNPKQKYTDADISPFLWPNGKLPTSEEWKEGIANNFEDYRLKVGGRVENTVYLSVAQLRDMMDTEIIAMHHCIQGWSGIAKWRGVSMKKIIELVGPCDDNPVVAFLSFGDGFEGGQYYDTQRVENLVKTGAILAIEMNDEPLPPVYGAPVRLRVDNQLGYKMVKWISEIRFIESEKNIGLGYGGKNSDDEFFDLVPNI